MLGMLSNFFLAAWYNSGVARFNLYMEFSLWGFKLGRLLADSGLSFL